MPEVTEQIAEEQQIQESSGEETQVTTSGAEDMQAEQSAEVTEEALSEVDAKARELQSEYDRKLAVIEKFSGKLAELQQKYPDMDMEAAQQQATQQQATQQVQQESLEDDYEYITKRDLQRNLQQLAQQIIGKVDATSTQRQHEDAQAFLAETFHEYGYMENGQWRNDSISEGARELARNTLADLNPSLPPAKMAAHIKNAIDGYYSRQLKARDKQRAEEKGAQKAAMQKQLARPETASAPAQTKQEIDPDLADLLKARKLSGLG